MKVADDVAVAVAVAAEAEASLQGEEKTAKCCRGCPGGRRHHDQRHCHPVALRSAGMASIGRP
jgi:hypothetical protein